MRATHLVACSSGKLFCVLNSDINAQAVEVTDEVQACPPVDPCGEFTQTTYAVLNGNYNTRSIAIALRPSFAGVETVLYSFAGGTMVKRRTRVSSWIPQVISTAQLLMAAQ